MLSITTKIYQYDATVNNAAHILSNKSITVHGYSTSSWPRLTVRIQAQKYHQNRKLNLILTLDKTSHQLQNQ